MGVGGRGAGEWGVGGLSEKSRFMLHQKAPTSPTASPVLDPGHPAGFPTSHRPLVLEHAALRRFSNGAFG